MDLCGASAVLTQLAQEFGHFNEIHPRSSLKLMSPGSPEDGRTTLSIRNWIVSRTTRKKITGSAPPTERPLLASSSSARLHKAPEISSSSLAVKHVNVLTVSCSRCVVTSCKESPTLNNVNSTPPSIGTRKNNTDDGEPQ